VTDHDKHFSHLRPLEEFERFIEKENDKADRRERVNPVPVMS
jgi:hypothetical protein